jgi:hypothetical protein
VSDTVTAQGVDSEQQQQWCRAARGSLKFLASGSSEPDSKPRRVE